MTTNIVINTNGLYVSEGSLTIEAPGGVGNTVYPIKVGPGYPDRVEQSFYVPHGSSATLDLKEREANDEERIALGLQPKGT